MPSLVELVVLCLACWRLTHMVQYERGPLGVFARVRSLVSIGHDADGEAIAWPDTEIGHLARCLWCGSVWVGMGLVGLYYWRPDIALAASLPFALSAAAIAIQGVTDGKG